MAITVVCPGDHPEKKHPPEADLKITRDEDGHWKIEPPDGWRLVEVRHSGAAVSPRDLFVVCSARCECSVFSNLSHAALEEAQRQERRGADGPKPTRRRAAADGGKNLPFRS